jgi:hypothetical protein
MQRFRGHPMRSITTIRQGRALAVADERLPEASLSDDIRLFAMFFLGGLTFMSVYLA